MDLASCGLIDLPVWQILVIALILLLYVHYMRNMRVLQRMGIPCDTPLPLVGSLKMFTTGFIEYLSDCYKRLGKVFGMYTGSTAVVCVGDLDMIRQILIKHFDHFHDHTQRKSLGNAFQKALTRLTGDHWKHVRTSLTPAFSSGKLKYYAEFIKHSANLTVSNLEKSADANEKFDSQKLFGNFAMDVICGTAFGIKSDCQNEGEENLYIKHASAFRKPSLMKFFVIFIFEKLAPIVMKLTGGMFEEPFKFFGDVTKNSLKDRLESPEKFNDFIQMMATSYELHLREGDVPDTNELGQWTRKGLTEDEIMNQAVLFFVAGFAGISNTLMFCAHSLATNPDIMANVLEELDREIEGDLDYQSVSKLTYLDQCIAEALRLYPIASLIERQCNKDFTFENGVSILKGTTVWIPVNAIHHDPEIYHDAERFIPERFSAEQKARRSQFAYMPFGVGPRNCIGMRLALLDIKMALAMILTKFRFIVCEETPIPLKMQKLRPNLPIKQCWLKVERR